MSTVHTRPLAWNPTEVQDLAVEKYELFKHDPFHPSLGFQAKGRVWTVDIGRSYRAIANRNETGCPGSGLVPTKITITF